MKKNSLTFRVLLILGIVIVLLIPLSMIQSLIYERQGYRDEATQEIYKSWAGEQIVAGPILTLEKVYTHTSADGKKYFKKKHIQYLPDNLNIQTELIPEIRYRGIYEVVLYKSKIKVSGNFQAINDLNKKEENLSSITKYLSFNISDLRGIEETVKLKLNKSDLTVIPGLKDDRLFKNGFLSYIEFEGDESLTFEAEIVLRGSSSIEFMPLGRITNLKIKSEWNNPSFTGSYLPTNRSITESGFTSEWKINHFNREFPQRWENKNYDIYQSKFGVKLLMPIDEYQKTMRTSKYGIMIIILTFVSFFMIEIFSKKVIHPIQYLLVGLSLIIFYSLLLSISEYIVFQSAYLLSSIAVIALIGLYIKSIYSSVKISLIIISILILFYGLMYIILQLQDYALLFGNLALFIILGIIMYITRKLNWFELFNTKNNTNKNEL